MRKSYRKASQAQDSDTPVIEVFGAALALLIILLVLVNTIVTQDIQAMLDRSTEGAEFKVSWQDGSEGLVVLSYKDKLRILETNTEVAKADICSAGSPFLDYVENIYAAGSSQQIIFAILDMGVDTMAIARDCLRLRWQNRPISIGWIIANQDLLGSVNLQDIPARIKRTIQE